jgi:hypothetical protein
MNKEQAIEAMQEGKKVTHEYFTSNEFMTMKGNKIVFEDGYAVRPLEFWSTRTAKNWDDGYSIWDDA